MSEILNFDFRVFCKSKKLTRESILIDLVWCFMQKTYYESLLSLNNLDYFILISGQ